MHKMPDNMTEEKDKDKIFNNEMWQLTKRLAKCRTRDAAVAVADDALKRVKERVGYDDEKMRDVENNLRYIVDGVFPKSETIKKADRDALEIGDSYLMPSRLAAGIQTLRDGTFDASATELTIEEYRAMPRPDKREPLLYLLIASKLPKGESVRGKIESLKALPISVHFSSKECRTLARVIYGRDDAQSRLSFNKLFASAASPKTVMFYYRDNYRFVSGNIITMSKVTDIHVLKDGTQLVTDQGVTFFPANLFYYYLERYGKVDLKGLVDGIRGKNGGMVCTIVMAAIAQWANILMRVRKVGEYVFGIPHDMIFEDIPEDARFRKQKKHRLYNSVAEAAETAACILKAKSWRCLKDGSVELVFDKSIDAGYNVLDPPTEE